MENRQHLDLAFLGFGEAATAFVTGWGEERPRRISAYDVKTAHAAATTRDAQWARYESTKVRGCHSLAEALQGSNVVFSVVTADQSLAAARTAANHIAPGTLYLDCNSCAPGTKRRGAEEIDRAGGRYVDVAIMAPVQPTLHQTPMLASGPHVIAALEVLHALRMTNAMAAEGPVGAASSIKMVRSIMVKGLEALIAECVLAGRRANVDEAVLDSLEATFPGFSWKERAAYMLERVIKHGVRRAAEMQEVALTIEELGLPADMAHATAQWQERIGALGLTARSGDYRQRADTVLQALGGPGEPAPPGSHHE